MRKHLSAEVSSRTQKGSKRTACPEIAEVEEPKSGFQSQFSDKLVR